MHVTRTASPEFLLRSDTFFYINLWCKQSCRFCDDHTVVEVILNWFCLSRLITWFLSITLYFRGLFSPLCWQPGTFQVSFAFLFTSYLLFFCTSIVVLLCTQQNSYSIDQSPNRHSDYTVTGQWWCSHSWQLPAARWLHSWSQRWLHRHCVVTVPSRWLME